MKSILLAGAATLALSVAAFAAGPNTATDPSTGYGQAPAASYGTGGYVFPDEGSPSGELGNLVTQPQPQSPQTGPFSHVYLFPPAADGGAD